MEGKASVRWYREKKAALKHEVWHDGSLGGDLFRMRAQCMELNARTYRWTETKGVKCVTGM